MTDMQTIIDKIDDLIKERDKQAREARKNKETWWDTVNTSRVMGLLDARAVVLEMLDEAGEKR